MFRRGEAAVWWGGRQQFSALGRPQHFFFMDVEGNVPGNVRHFGWLRLAPLKPSGPRCFAVAKVPFLGASAARQLGVEGDVPGNCFMGFRKQRDRQH